MNKIKTFLKEYPMANNHKIIIGFYSLLLSLATILPLKKWYFVIVILTILIYILICLIYKTIKYYQANSKRKNKRPINIKWWIFVVIFIALFSVDLIVLLANYPGLGNFDSEDILRQAVGFTSLSQNYEPNDLSNHHSLFYTFLFWLSCQLTSHTGDINNAIFLFLICQIILICLFLCFSIKWATKHCYSKFYIIFLIIFITINPLIISYSSKMLKDVPYSFLIVILAFILYDISTKRSISKTDYFKLTLICLLICLLRNTGIFVCVITFVYLFVLKILNRKILSFIGLTLIMIVAIVQWPLSDFIGSKHANFVEAVGVPVQQIAKSFVDEGPITDDQKAFISNIIPTNKMAEKYDKTQVDIIKLSEDFNNEYLNNHKIEFLSTYLAMLPFNFKSYLTAWVWETYGYWSPCRAAALAGNSPILYEDIHNYIGFEIAPWKICNFIPYRIIFNNSGLFIWILIAFLMLKKMLVNKSWKIFFKENSCFVPFFVVFFILLLSSPKTDELRYVISLYLIIPYLPCFYNSKINKNIANK